MASFWSRVLGWRLGDPWRGHPELRSFEPPAGHVVRPPSGDRRSGQGAPRLRERRSGRDRRRAVDLARARGAARPLANAAVARRLALLCAPSRQHDRRNRRPGRTDTAAAWSRSASTPPWPPTSRRSPSGGPAGRTVGQLARVSSPASGTTTPGHPSSCSSSASTSRTDRFGPISTTAPTTSGEVRRVMDLGADDIGPGRGGWHALRDPAGRRSASRRTPRRTRSCETSADADAISGPGAVAEDDDPAVEGQGVGQLEGARRARSGRAGPGRADRRRTGAPTAAARRAVRPPSGRARAARSRTGRCPRPAAPSAHGWLRSGRGR